LGGYLRSFGLSSFEPLIFEGHEANYLDFYFHEAQLGISDTASYLSMQFWWTIWGYLVPFGEVSPLVITIVVSLASIVFLVLGTRNLFKRDSAGLIIGLWVATNPLHVAWSTSIYNVMPPFFFMSLSLFCISKALDSHRKWAWLAGLSFGLAVSTRVDSAVLGVLWGAILVHRKYPLKAAIGPIALALICYVVLGLPALFKNDVPGSGEWAMAFANNWSLDILWKPYVFKISFFLLLLFGLILKGNQRLLFLSGFVYLLIHHLSMSIFNDYGSRHTMPALIVIGLMFSIPKQWWLSLSLIIVIHVPAYLDLKLRFHAESEDYSQWLFKHYPNLALQNYEDRGDCSWINESEAFSQQPVRSHFNLLSEKEFEGYLDETGCVDWCMDVKDWQWSSLGVHDRALRIKELYELIPVGIIESNGQHCLQWRVLRPKTFGF
jgi:hypothetical protein